MKNNERPSGSARPWWVVPLVTLLLIAGILVAATFLLTLIDDRAMSYVGVGLLGLGIVGQFVLGQILQRRDPQASHWGFAASMVCILVGITFLFVNLFTGGPIR